MLFAFEAFAQAVDIPGSVCIMCNDAAAAVAAFSKGNLSPPMQRCALRQARAAAAQALDYLLSLVCCWSTRTWTRRVPGQTAGQMPTWRRSGGSSMGPEAT